MQFGRGVITLHVIVRVGYVKKECNKFLTEILIILEKRMCSLCIRKHLTYCIVFDMYSLCYTELY